MDKWIDRYFCIRMHACMYVYIYTHTRLYIYIYIYMVYVYILGDAGLLPSTEVAHS